MTNWPQTGVEELATWIEAHSRLRDAKLSDWLWTTQEISVSELSGWLRDEKKVAPTKHSLALAEQLLRDGGCCVIPRPDSRYPLLIKAAWGETAPPLLYCRGNLDLLQSLEFAVIGTRRPSALGKRAARLYTRFLVTHGWVIVSGNAPGVDAAAHEEALAYGGATVVFPPTPLDTFQPSFRWSEEWERCLVVSRYVPGSEITPWNFLGRNQLVAAMCRGALVAETGMRGGTLDTVGHLRRLRRRVFVTDLPPEAKHCRAHQLLKASGATPVPVAPLEEFAHELLMLRSTSSSQNETNMNDSPDFFGEHRMP